VAPVIVAEIGDITRFPSARKLASWAGMTPTVRGSDLKIRHGHITRAGLGLAAMGTQKGRADCQAVPEFAVSYAAIAKPRGKKIATIAIAASW
jgi:transposase IS116/IS110/IS902 family protein